MGKNTKFLESSATNKEDSYKYRIEWDDYITVDYVWNESTMKAKHNGPSLRNVLGFDNAWDLFNDYKNNPDYIGVRLIQIDSNGIENIYASK